MAAQKGRDLLVKIAEDSGTYKTILGLRAKTLNLNARAVDITHSESASAWRELLPGAGVKTLDVTGKGIFQDGVSDGIMREAFFAQSQKNLQIVIPDFGIIEGGFLVSSLSYSGEYDGEATYEITLSSAGLQTFAAL